MNLIYYRRHMYERKVFKKNHSGSSSYTLPYFLTHTHTFYRHRQMQLSPCK